MTFMLQMYPVKRDRAAATIQYSFTSFEKLKTAQVNLDLGPDGMGTLVWTNIF